MNVQHSDWDQVFEEVEREIHELLGQIDLPGFVPKQAQPMTAEQERRPVFDESRMLGAGALQLAAGEPLHMGAGEVVVPRAEACKTCRHGDCDGCNNADADAETCSRPDFALYEPREEEDKARANPFKTDTRHTIGIRDRLNLVKGFGAEQLRAVIALPGCQKSVAKAAERRLRKLESEATKSGMSYEANAKSCRNCQNNLPGGCEVEGECDNDLSRWAEVGAA